MYCYIYVKLIANSAKANIFIGGQEGNGSVFDLYPCAVNFERASPNKHLQLNVFNARGWMQITETIKSHTGM